MVQCVDNSVSMLHERGEYNNGVASEYLLYIKLKSINYCKE